MLAKLKKKSKNIKNKILRNESEQLPIRITNDNVAVHRERTIAGGRRFKYPIQYARHKLVYNAIILVFVAVVVLVIFGWWQLYNQQTTNTFFYRVTKVLPLPVAKFDSTWVMYDDYLMKLRSSLYYLENKEQINLSTEDGKLQKNYVQEVAMNDAVADAYAIKKANELHIRVTDEELNKYLLAQRQSTNADVSEQSYDSVIADYYNWTPDEYKTITKNKLLRQKVAYAVDDEASKLKDQVKTSLSTGQGLKDLVSAINTTSGRRLEFVSTGWISKTNSDGGLTLEASKLTKGQVSPDAVQPMTGDGYYFIKLIDSNDKQVNYEYIKIPLGTLKQSIDDLLNSSKVNYFITMPTETKEDVNGK